MRNRGKIELSGELVQCVPLVYPKTRQCRERSVSANIKAHKIGRDEESATLLRWRTLTGSEGSNPCISAREMLVRGEFLAPRMRFCHIEPGHFVPPLCPRGYTQGTLGSRHHATKLRKFLISGTMGSWVLHLWEVERAARPVHPSQLV